MDIIKNNLYKEKNPIFSVPKGKLTLESPEKLDTFEDSLFTCYAFTNVMPLPSDLKLKLTSHQTDHLAELSSSDAVELQSGKIFTPKLRHQGAICWLKINTILRLYFFRNKTFLFFKIES